MKGLFFIIALLPFIIFAQVKNDSLEYATPDVQNSWFNTKLDKQLSTYTLTNNLQLFQRFNSFDVNLLENYTSTLVKSGEKNVKDEHFFSFKSAYNISPGFSIGIKINNNILSDSRKIEINNASVSDAAIYSSFSPETGVSVIPYLGYTNNRQIGENDYGYIYGLEALTNLAASQDFIIASSLRFKNEDINPRKNFLRFFHVELKNLFAENVNNNFLLNYSSGRKDFYYIADSITSRAFNVKNNIQSRIETSYNLQDRFAYAGLFDVFNLDMIMGVNWREIDRDTRYQAPDIKTSYNYDYKINELKFELEQNIGFNLGWFEGMFRGIYSERDETHVAKNITTLNRIFADENDRIETDKNNSSIRNSLSFTGSMNLSSSDKLLFSLFHNKLVYNTQSKTNYDDRDELYSIIRVKYYRTFSPFFSMFINTEADFNHIVYLFSERSSNNNLNRVIKLSSGGNYTGRNFSSANIFEVSANYTVYDFEELNPNLKSFSFRQFSVIDSSALKLSNRLSLVFFGNVKLSEQGDFKWNSFATSPVQYLEEMYFEPKILSVYENFSFSVGLRYFSLNTFRFKKLEKYADAEYRSSGPSTEIYFNGGKGMYIHIKGYYEFIKTNNSANREIPNVNCDIIWKF